MSRILLTSMQGWVSEMLFSLNVTILTVLSVLLAFILGLGFGAMLSYWIFIRGMLYGIEKTLTDEEKLTIKE